MVEKNGMKIKPKFTVAYGIIILLAIFSLVGISVAHGTGSVDASFFTISVFGIIIIGLLILLSLFLKWLATTYIITEDEITVKEGLVTQTTTSTSARHIENFTIKRGLMDRLLGTASIFMDTAGGPGHEIVMHYIDTEKLEVIQRKLKKMMQLMRRGEVRIEPGRVEPSVVKEEALQEMERKIKKVKRRKKRKSKSKRRR